MSIFSWQKTCIFTIAYDILLIRKVDTQKKAMVKWICQLWHQEVESEEQSVFAILISFVKWRVEVTTASLKGGNKEQSFLWMCILEIKWRKKRFLKYTNMPLNLHQQRKPHNLFQHHHSSCSYYKEFKDSTDKVPTTACKWIDQ